jgi:small subunit ribosomal protein S20
MPNIKSAKKRMRQNVVRKLRNRGRISRMRTEIRRFREMVTDKKMGEAKVQLGEVYSVIDKTAQSGVIHRKAGARYKSRLVKLLGLEKETS